MGRDVGNLAAAHRALAPSLPARPCGIHPLGGDASFTAHDCVCDSGRHSPRAEGVYARPKICVMLRGAFFSRSQRGSVVAGPGALLLGSAGAGYEYRHLDDGGDRSVSFIFDPDALGVAGFRATSVPASARSVHAVELTVEALRGGDLEALREAALAVAALAVTVDRSDTASPAQATRISHVLRYIEAHADGDCTLDTLAAHARLSAFHFLRTFRAVTGQTPRQVVIATRLRAAAALLRTTRQPVSDVAFAAGFGDVSHFMASFARAFGRSPASYRRLTGTRA